jgi:DNA-directed RNA polymerase subunit RPC12/RpoP
MEMAFKFNCPSCNSEIVVKYLKVGERAKCWSCGTEAVVPENAAEGSFLQTPHPAPASSSTPRGARISEEEARVRDLVEAVKKDLADGKSKEEIVKELVKKKWPEESAVQFVNAVEKGVTQFGEWTDERQELAKHYSRHMLYGVLWMVGGIVVTAATYSAASSSAGGGTYIVAWGAILFGFIDFMRGLFGWLKYSEGGAGEQAEEEQKDYSCSDCGHDIETGQLNCPNCGIEIDWSEA